MVRLPPPLRPLFPFLKPVYTYATQAVAPVTTAASRRRLGANGLPTGWVATLEEAAATTGGRCLPVRPAQQVTREPLPEGPLTDVFMVEQSEVARRIDVAELPAGRVLGPHHAVISGRNDLIQDVSYYFGTTQPRQHPAFLHPFPAAPTEIDGTLGVLATRGDVNYYHFLIDLLPRLWAARTVYDSADEPHRWYVPLAAGFQRELLDLAGVEAHSCVDAATHHHVRAETLVVPTQPSMTGVNPSWVVDVLRSMLLSDSIPRVRGRGLYVTRGASANNRAVVNEADVIAAMSDRGFAVMDAGAVSVSDQIRAFSEASVIVAAHGAALANLVFANHGATVVELFPAGTAIPLYWKLALATPGVRYRYLVGRGSTRVRSGTRMLVSDITVDVPRLQREIDSLIDT